MSATIFTAVTFGFIFSMFSCQSEPTQEELDLASQRVSRLLASQEIDTTVLEGRSLEIQANLDSEHARERTRYFSGLVDTICRHLGGSTDLIKAIIYTEALEHEQNIFGIFSSYLPPMNPHPIFFQPIYSTRNASARTLKRQIKNLEMGIRIIAALEDAVTPEKVLEIATLYKDPAAQQISEYAVKVQMVLEQRLFE